MRTYRIQSRLRAILCGLLALTFGVFFFAGAISEAVDGHLFSTVIALLLSVPALHAGLQTPRDVLVIHLEPDGTLLFVRVRGVLRVESRDLRRLAVHESRDTDDPRGWFLQIEHSGGHLTLPGTDGVDAFLAEMAGQRGRFRITGTWPRLRRR